MKKILIAAAFILLFGLFSGLFFSTELSEENKSYLSALLASSINDPSPGFFNVLLSSLFSNFLLAALVLSAALSKLLCPLPFIILWYKCFTVGFCSGLVYLSEIDKAFLISLFRIIPPAAFIIPAFAILSATVFIYSQNEFAKSKRPSREKKDLQTLAFISLAAIAAGCITEAICSL